MPFLTGVKAGTRRVRVCVRVRRQRAGRTTRLTPCHVLACRCSAWVALPLASRGAAGPTVPALPSFSSWRPCAMAASRSASFGAGGGEAASEGAGRGGAWPAMPAAQQPDVLRAAQKDAYYSAQVRQRPAKTSATPSARLSVLSRSSVLPAVVRQVACHVPVARAEAAPPPRQRPRGLKHWSLTRHALTSRLFSPLCRRRDPPVPPRSWVRRSMKLPPLSRPAPRCGWRPSCAPQPGWRTTPSRQGSIGRRWAKSTPTCSW